MLTFFFSFFKSQFSTAVLFVFTIVGLYINHTYNSINNNGSVRRVFFTIIIKSEISQLYTNHATQQ